MNVQIVVLASIALALTNGQNCPPGIPVTMCARNPCSGAVCESFPSAKCIPNYCGGCNAHFYIDDDVRVYDCNPRHPRIETVRFGSQNKDGFIEANNLKMIIHHDED